MHGVSRVLEWSTAKLFLTNTKVEMTRESGPDLTSGFPATLAIEVGPRLRGKHVVEVPNRLVRQRSAQ